MEDTPNNDYIIMRATNWYRNFYKPGFKGTVMVEVLTNHNILINDEVVYKKEWADKPRKEDNMDKIIRYLHITYPAGRSHSTATLASIETIVTEDVVDEIDVNGISYDKQNKVYAITFSFADSIPNTVCKANERVSDAIENIVTRLNADNFGLEAWVDKDGVIQVKKGGE